MARTQDMFGPKPRQPRRVMMFVVDAGFDGCVDVIQFQCHRCHYNTGWIECDQTVTQNKRGMPCPDCNPPESDNG